MTKKNYIAIAKGFNEIVSQEHNADEMRMLNTILFNLMNTFQEDNNMFDRTRFLDAVYKNVVDETIPKGERE